MTPTPKPIAMRQPRSARTYEKDHRCFCGRFGAYSYGKPGWPQYDPPRYFCKEHMHIAEEKAR